MAPLISRWFNPRSVFTVEELVQIYGPTMCSDANVFKPLKVLEHKKSIERWIEIPEEVKAQYEHIGRPTRLVHAKKLSQACGLQVFLKREDRLSTLSFKGNLVIPQFFYARKEGYKWGIIETSAGYTAISAAYAGQLNEMAVEIAWTRARYEKRLRHRELIEKLGAQIHRSPLFYPEENPDLITASNDCYRVLKQQGGGFKATGSFCDYALLYNSVVGLEIGHQIEDYNAVYPCLVIAPAGGGSIAGGTFFPLLGNGMEFMAIENAVVPKVTAGVYSRVKQYEHLSHWQLLFHHEGVVEAQDVGGLSSKILSPLLSKLIHDGRVGCSAVSPENATLAQDELIKTEGVCCAQESAFGVAYLLKNAAELRKKYKSVIVVISGSGLLEL